MAWIKVLTVDGILQDPKELNEAWMRETGSAEPWCNPESDEWRAWVEYGNGQTHFFADVEK